MKTLYIDCRNTKCPMSIVKTARAIRTIESGDMLRVEATDPAFDPDIKAWTRKTGHILEELRQDNGLRIAIIKKS